MNWITYIRFESSPSSEEERGPRELSAEQVSVRCLSQVTRVNLSWKFISHVQSHVFLVFQTLWVEAVGVVVFAVCTLSVQVSYWLSNAQYCLAKIPLLVAALFPSSQVGQGSSGRQQGVSFPGKLSMKRRSLSASF